MTGHKTTAPWYPRVARVKIASYRTMKAAYFAEQAAIKNERPLFNKANAVITWPTLRTGNMNVEQVIMYFGGCSATARALNLKQPSVSKWRKNKQIPYLRQLDIEKRTKGKLKAEGK